MGEVVAKRKLKLKNFLFSWVKDNYDILFLVVLALAFIIRIWVFYLTKDQAIWWDAADYLSTAKKWGLSLPIRETWYYRRGFFWPLFGAIIFKLSLGETTIRFFEVLFSTGIVAISYFLITKMFNKKLALYTSIGIAASWVLLFFTGRPLTSIPATFFLLLATLCFWKGYVEKQGNKFMVLFGLFYAMAILTRMQYLMFALVFLLFVFTKEKFSFLKRKSLWISVLVFLVVISPHIILYWRYFGNPIIDILGFYLGIKGIAKAEVTSPRQLADLPRYFFDLPYIMYKFMFILFLIGALYFLLDLILGLDKIFKDKQTQNKFFVILWIIINFCVIGYVSTTLEQRYIIPSIPFLFLIAIYPLPLLEKIIQKYFKLNKNLSKAIVILLLILILIPNITWGKDLINNKKTSYLEIKQAGEWIKDNSYPEDIIISGSLPHILYYSERSTYPINLINEAIRKQSPEFAKYRNMTDVKAFEDLINEKKPKYLMLSALEVHPQWVLDYPQQHQELLKPVKVFYQGEIPVVIIYEFQY